MKINRKIEMMIATRHRYIIRKSSSKTQTVFCAKCGEPMLTAEQTAGIFGITQRRVFQFIETGAVHYTEAGAVMICLSSLAAVLDGDS